MRDFSPTGQAPAPAHAHGSPASTFSPSFSSSIPSVTYRRTVEPWRCPLCRIDCRPKTNRPHEPCAHFVVVADTMDAVRALADVAPRGYETYAMTYHRGVAVTWFVFEMPDRRPARNSARAEAQEDASREGEGEGDTEPHKGMQYAH